MPVNNSAEKNTEPGLRFAKRSFLLISSNLLKLFVQLSIIFLYSRYLSFEDYGLYQSVWLYVNVTGIIALFGFPSMILSASTKNIKQWIRNNRRYFLCFAILLNLLPLGYMLFGTDLYDTPTKFLLIVLTVVQNISILAETLAVKNEKETRVLIANIIFSSGYFICHYLILNSGYSLQLLLIWIVLAYIIKSVMLWSPGRDGVETNLPVKQLGRQWLFLGLFDVISVLFKWLDKWVILFFVSVSQFAIYFNGAYEIPVFALILSAVGNIMLVELSRHHSPEPAKVSLLFMNTSFFLASIVFPSFSFLFFYHQEFFTFIFSEKYQGSIPVFLVSIFVLPVRITNFTAALQVFNRSDLVVKGAVLDLLVAVIFMAIFYPLFGLPGLALSFVLSTYIQAGYYLWHTSKLLGKEIAYFFPFRRLILLLLISLMVIGSAYYAFQQFVWPLNFIIGIIVCILLIGCLMLWYFKTHKKLIPL